MTADDASLADTLAAMPVFAGLSAEELHDVAQSIRVREVKAGKTLIKQHQWGHELLIVLTGEVEVRRDDEVIAVQGPGSVVGEVAVLTDTRRNATVVTRTNATIGSVEYTQLHALLDTIPLLDERLGAIAREHGAR